MVYSIGTQVTVNSDHMPGMKGARAVITNAVLSNIYQITYHPNDGGQVVHNHKWIIQEEIKDAPHFLLKKGQEFTCLAEHMEDMYMAKGVIEEGAFDVAYEISYIPTDSPEQIVVHHKWFKESELETRQVKDSMAGMKM